MKCMLKQQNKIKYHAAKKRERASECCFNKHIPKVLDLGGDPRKLLFETAASNCSFIVYWSRVMNGTAASANGVRRLTGRMNSQRLRPSYNVQVTSLWKGQNRTAFAVFRKRSLFYN